MVLLDHFSLSAGVHPQIYTGTSPSIPCVLFRPYYLLYLNTLSIHPFTAIPRLVHLSTCSFISIYTCIQYLITPSPYLSLSSRSCLSTKHPSTSLLGLPLSLAPFASLSCTLHRALLNSIHSICRKPSSGTHFSLCPTHPPQHHTHPPTLLTMMQ